MGDVSTRSRHLGGKLPQASVSDLDRKRMAAIAAFTARSLRTERPRPFGASIVHTKSGEMLLRALNAVAQ